MGGSFRDSEHHPTERRAQEPPVGARLSGRGGDTPDDNARAGPSRRGAGRAVGPGRRHRPHRGGLQDAVRHHVGPERGGNERAGRALRRSGQAGSVRRAHQVVPRQHEPASFPSQRPLLRRRVRHLVDGNRRDVRSGAHGAGARGQLRRSLRGQGPLRRRQDRRDHHPGLGHGAGDVDAGREEIMKIRIGVGAAGGSSTPGALAELVTGLDELGFDSLWLSEVLTGPVLDPIVGLSWAAASNPRVKLGTTMLLPGRNVVRLAKQLASLDVLCNGRLLVTLVPGLTYSPEREAIGVDPKRRGAVIDEALPLLRRLWAGETVSHDGPAGSLREVKLSPLPVQQPLEVWLGGTAPAALERCGRLSDGGLPPLSTPAEAGLGRILIEEPAARARVLCGALFGALVLWIANRRNIVAQWRDGGGPVLIAAVCMATASTCFIFALSRTSVANTLILMSTGPFVAGLLGFLLLGERVAPRTWLTMAVALPVALVMGSNSYGGGAIVGDLLAVVMAGGVAPPTLRRRPRPPIQMAPGAALPAARPPPPAPRPAAPPP